MQRTTLRHERQSGQPVTQGTTCEDALQERGVRRGRGQFVCGRGGFVGGELGLVERRAPGLEGAERLRGRRSGGFGG